MRDFSKAKRIVIKIGTNTLSKKGAIGIDIKFIKEIAKQIHSIILDGREIIIVTSGAIGMGASQLPIKEVSDLKMKQAYAAIGQPLLMAEYRKSFARFNVTVAQVLLTAEVLNNRKTYLNLKNSIESLLKLGVVPVINENDSVSIDEIEGMSFGDNDKLSARVASKMDADLLIMLTDVEGLFEKDPRKFQDAKRISVATEITDRIAEAADGTRSKHARGGMITKIEAVKIAFNAGCKTVIAKGKDKNILIRILKGEDVGTVFVPTNIPKLENWERWLLNSEPSGKIKVKRIWKKLKNKLNILPQDILSVEGWFQQGAVIAINDDFKGISEMRSTEIEKYEGLSLRKLRELGEKGHTEFIVVKHTNIVHRSK